MFRGDLKCNSVSANGATEPASSRRGAGLAPHTIHRQVSAGCAMVRVCSDMEGEVAKAKKRSVGRPKVHTEEMIPVLVRIPRSMVTQIDKLGGSRQAAVLAAIAGRLRDGK